MERKELDTEVGRKAEKLIVLGSKEESTVAEDVVGARPDAARIID